MPDAGNENNEQRVDIFVKHLRAEPFKPPFRAATLRCVAVGSKQE